MVPGIASYASASTSKNEKVCTIGDRKELGKRFIYFKCFSDANIKQIAPTLVDETPLIVVIHIGSNDITKMSYKTTNVQDPAQGIINVGLKCKSYGVSRIAISSILTRRSAQLNQLIGQCATNGFHYISNEMIDH